MSPLLKPSEYLPFRPPREAAWFFVLAAWVCLAATGFVVADSSAPPAPHEVLGHPVGADGELASYAAVLSYLQQVADASPRVSLQPAGTSTLGREMVVVAVSSADNLRQIERYRRIAQRLAQAEGLEPDEAARLAEEGKVVALITGTIHATEVASTQMFMELVHDLATTRDEEVLGWLNEVILLIMPSINPDGQDLVRDWYLEHKGTAYDGGPMPWLYHHYVGHDNNRDFYMLTQTETRVVNDVLYHRWFPQVFLDEHQMGRTGPRMFVPPQTNPLAPEIDALIFRQADLLGTVMSMRLEEDGRQGVGHNMIFDSYWPGGTRNTAWWKNVTGLLTEVASVRIASPVYIEKGELEGNRKGLPDYGRRSNYPSPWEGGWWRLRDIVEYELTATMAFLEGCARFRSSLLENIYTLGRRQIEAGRRQAPYAFLIPPGQHDPVAAGRLVELLLRHGVKAMKADRPFTVDNRSYPAGTTVLPAAQPYRPFLLTMLRPQRYPEVRASRQGPILPPYDVTSWSLPLSMGVTVDEAKAPLSARLSPLKAPSWPSPPRLSGRSGLVIPHAADSAPILTNRALAAGHPVYWLDTDHGDAGRGDLFIPAAGPAGDDLSGWLEELHVPGSSLKQAPTGPALRVNPVRIGLFKPWRASMDEGWTRFLLDRYEFQHGSVHNEDLRDGSFTREFDVLLFPDVSPDIIASGQPAGAGSRRFEPLPPPYDGGIGEPGGAHLRRWVSEEGGTVVALDSSGDYLIDLLQLPVTNTLADVKRETFDCPGAMLRMQWDLDHVLARGLRREEAGYFASSPAYRTTLPDSRFSRRVVASYPADARDVLASGYLKGAGHLARRAAVVDLNVGRGRVILIGFRAQHRAQTLRTLKVLFNSLYLPGLSEESL